MFKACIFSIVEVLHLNITTSASGECVKRFLLYLGPWVILLLTMLAQMLTVPTCILETTDSNVRTGHHAPKNFCGLHQSLWTNA
jgi:hypothetical protein